MPTVITDPKDDERSEEPWDGGDEDGNQAGNDPEDEGSQ